VLIRPTTGFILPGLGELFEHRELIYFLTRREIQVRYKQTLIGAAWAILQPLLTMAIFTIFFGRLAKMPSDGVSYSAFALAGLVPWMFFANALTQSANSLVGNSALLTKVYFPRLAIPVSAALSGLMDLSFGFGILLIYTVLLGMTPTVKILFLPLFVAVALISALGAGFWLSALNVEFRDVRYVVPFLTQLWLFCSPVLYPSTLVRNPWRAVYGLNPLVGVLDGFRWAVLDTHSPSFGVLATSSASAVLLLVSGAFFFRRLERRFADVL
jgi:lipopolysaccharide transport system permease protein